MNILEFEKTGFWDGKLIIRFNLLIFKISTGEEIAMKGMDLFFLKSCGFE